MSHRDDVAAEAQAAAHKAQNNTPTVSNQINAPRTGDAATPALTPSAPAFQPGTNIVPVPSPPLDDDDEEDEFSPFAKQPAAAVPPLLAPDIPQFVPMTPFDVFCGMVMQQNPALFTGTDGQPPRLTPQLLQDALERSNYDVEATLATLRGAPPPSLQPQSPPGRPSWRAPSGVSVVPRDMFARVGAEGTSAPESTTRVCRFFLAGECRRSDCRFSHDLGKALCRFWLRGTCLNDPCSFLHDFDALTTLVSRATIDEPEPKPAEPEPLSPPAPAPRKRDPSSTRWAAAAQKPKVQTAAERIAHGAATVPQSALRAPTREASPVVQAAVAAPAPTVVPRSRMLLRPPTLLPTLTTGAALASEFTKLRASGANAERLIRERHSRIRETLVIAAGGDAGGWGSSAQASDERGAHGLRGRWIGGNLGLCLGVARAENVARVARGVRDLSLEERTEAFLDLHGLQPDEAVEMAERFLLALESERFRGIAVLGVGAAKHSSRRGGRIAGDVRAFLSGWGYVSVD